MDKRPIGVFDSGIGGLTVLTELDKMFKNEDFIYIGDQGHCPYGTKPNNEIEECVLNVAKKLISLNCKAIVIACNTASFFIESVRKITDIPVISVIDPTCDYAVNTSKNGNIMVLGTNATIKNHAYQDRIINAGKNVVGVPASDFVEFAENYDLNDPKGLEIAKRLLEPHKNDNCDTLIHGCTHFSLVEHFMREVLGDINYVACGYPTSLALKEILDKKEINNVEHNGRYIKIYTTGSIENAINSMKWFKAEHEEIKEIEL